MKRMMVAVIFVIFSSLIFTACEPDMASGTCAHAASAKTTNEANVHGLTKPQAETYIWMRWLAFNDCTQGPLAWTNYDRHCYSWWYLFATSTNTLADSCWHEVYDSVGGKYGSTAVVSAAFQTDNDVYGLKSRVYAAPDGWVHWYCGRTDNYNGGGQVGHVVCDFNID